MLRQLARMSRHPPLLEVGRGGTHEPLQRTNRFVDDAWKGDGKPRDRDVETFRAGVHRAVDERHIEAYERKLLLKFGERFGQIADRHRRRDLDADVAFDLLRRVAHFREHFVVVMHQAAR